MSQVQEIKDAISIVEIIGERIQLTAAGGYFRGLCPFHGEKSPSFFVDERIGHYRCFGCSESGDVFTFLEKYDNLTFREALEYLAERAGIKLEQNTDTAEDKLKKRTLQVLESASQYFINNLQTAPAKIARDYLEKRAMSADTIKTFGLGFASHDWRGLSSFLKSQKFSTAEIVAAGLAIEKDTGNIYDRFRERLMFPLRNHRGQVVGFSGRTLSGDETEAKYINSPETILYHKSKMLYGLVENANFIKKSGQIIVVEGEFDMLSSVQAHVNNVVAIKGSALTSDHAKIIARYVKTVCLALDSDSAGVKATAHALEVLRDFNLELKVIAVPDGKDPDDFARANPSAWREQTNKAVSPYEYFLQVAAKKYHLTAGSAVDIDTKNKVLSELVELFARIDNLLEKNHYHKKLAVLLGEDVELIGEELARRSKIAAGNLPTASKKPAAKTKTTAAGKAPTAMQKQEMYLWFLFLQLLEGDLVETRGDFFLKQITHWQSKLAEKFAGSLAAYLENTGHYPTLKAFTASLPADYQEKIAALLLSQTYTKLTLGSDLNLEWANAVRKYLDLQIKSKLADLNHELQQLDNKDNLTADDEARQSELLSEVVKLQKRLK
jgi:DNA primase